MDAPYYNGDDDRDDDEPRCECGMPLTREEYARRSICERCLEDYLRDKAADDAYEARVQGDR